jgi:hypothetical protein
MDFDAENFQGVWSVRYGLFGGSPPVRAGRARNFLLIAKLRHWAAIITTFLIYIEIVWIRQGFFLRIFLPFIYQRFKDLIAAKAR